MPLYRGNTQQGQPGSNQLYRGDVKQNIGPQTMNQPMQGQQLASNQSMSDTYDRSQGALPTDQYNQRQQVIPQDFNSRMPLDANTEPYTGAMMAQNAVDSQGNPINWGLLQQILQQRGLA
jgi:hypothetical protein